MSVDIVHPQSQVQKRSRLAQAVDDVADSVWVAQLEKH